MAAYRSLRRLNGAVSPCLELSALSSGVAPCADELALPVLEELTALAIDHLGDANDLWSYHKEFQEPGAIPTLLPHVLMAERDISLPEAVTATANLCDDLIRAFQNKASTIEPTAPVQVLRYLDVLRAWVRGNLEWSAHCHRYHLEG
ncbi:terpene synthase family protein [Streptomyces sp. NPDC001177]